MLGPNASPTDIMRELEKRRSEDAELSERGTQQAQARPLLATLPTHRPHDRGRKKGLMMPSSPDDVCVFLFVWCGSQALSCVLSSRLRGRGVWCVCSPMVRALRTIEPTAQALGLTHDRQAHQIQHL